MKIYVGYIMADYAQALFMSMDEKKVKEKLKKVKEETKNSTWVECYNLSKENLIELE